MMSYEEFVQKARESIHEYLSDEFKDVRVTIDKTEKNNNEVFDSISIRKDGEIIVPQLYINDYYSVYMNTASFTTAMMEMSGALQKREIPKLVFDDINDVFDFAKVQDKLMLQIVNAESNKEMLKEILHKRIENTDMAAIFRIQVGADESNIASTKVKNTISERWNMSVESLYEIALKNMEREHPFVITSIEEILFGMKGEVNENILPQKLDEFGMYVLSNKMGINGAAAFLYPNLMDKIGEHFGGSYFVFPSSIHELILMKDNGALQAEELHQLVKEVNMNEVKPDEILSDSVFYYNAEEHSFSMLDVNEQTEDIVRNQEHFSDGFYDPMENEDEEDLEM